LKPSPIAICLLLAVAGAHAGDAAPDSDAARVRVRIAPGQPVAIAVQPDAQREPAPPAEPHRAAKRSIDMSRAVDSAALHLRSASVLVIDQDSGRAVVARNPDAVTPIASITKLMTAMVVLDSGAPLDHVVTISAADFDMLKGTHSRLQAGVGLNRRELLHLALMSSENRAAAALARAHPAGFAEFVTAMNHKAAALGMQRTHFVDSTGLSSENVSTAADLAKMVMAAYAYPLIREFTTATSHDVEPLGTSRTIAYRNSNSLVKSPQWEIGLSKTGYISEAGRCLVMQARLLARPFIIVLLDSVGKQTRIGDANRIKRWIESRHQAGKPVG